VLVLVLVLVLEDKSMAALLLVAGQAHRTRRRLAGCVIRGERLR